MTIEDSNSDSARREPRSGQRLALEQTIQYFEGGRLLKVV
jgi:hypothetical protein